MPTAPPVRQPPVFAPTPTYGYAPAAPTHGNAPAPPFGGPPSAPVPPVAAPASPDQGGRAVSALIGAIVGAVVAALIAAVVVAHVDDQPRQTGTASPATTSAGSGSPSPSGSSAGRTGALDVQAVLTEAEPSVVSVQTEVGEGSGFVISADGFVVTNYHVIEGASSLRVRFQDSKVVTADMVGSFPDNDVALIKVRDRTDLVPSRLGSSAALKVGDDVLAIGNALGLGAAPSVTLGIVSAKDRSVPIDGAVLDHLIQTDAAINHGNSGGPLVNASGEVVGINTLVAEGANSIGFALSIDSVKPLIEELKAGRGEITPNTAFLGVSSVAVDDPAVDPQELKDEGVTSTFGALVVEVSPGSPAEKAGIRAGDVIVQADGNEVRSADDVGKAVRSHKAGEPIALVYERRGVRADKQVVLTRKGR